MRITGCGFSKVGKTVQIDGRELLNLASTNFLDFVGNPEIEVRFSVGFFGHLGMIDRLNPINVWYLPYFDGLDTKNVWSVLVLDGPDAEISLFLL